MTGLGLARLTEPYTQRKATMANWDFLTAELAALDHHGMETQPESGMP
jgi:hypothetical protein